MGHVLFVAIKLFLQRKRQTVVSVMGVAIGMSAFVVMSSLMLGFQKYFVKQVIDLDAHVSIRPELNYDERRILAKVFGENALLDILGTKPKDVRDQIKDYRALMNRYMNLEEVVGISPHLRGNAIIRYGAKEVPVNLFGIDPFLEEKASSISRYLERNNLSLLERNRRGIILGKLVARDLGIESTGKKVLLITSTGLSEAMEVVDFFNSGITTIDNSRAYIHIKTAQRVWGRPGEVNELIIKLKNVEDAVRIAKKIKNETPYNAQSWQEAYSNFLQLFKVQKIITYLVVGAILVVSSFGIFNILMMMVLEKKRDIAILKAIGFSSLDISLIFLSQGLLIGVLGATIGGISSYFIQNFLEGIEIDLEGLLRAKGFILDRSWWYYLWGGLFSVSLSVFASLYPSRKASRLQPIDIFRQGA